MKYGIVSESQGWLVICGAELYRFSHNPEFIMDFLSESGAQGFLTILHQLHPQAPQDCEVAIWEF